MIQALFPCLVKINEALQVNCYWNCHPHITQYMISQTMHMTLDNIHYSCFEHTGAIHKVAHKSLNTPDTGAYDTLHLYIVGTYHVQRY